MEKKIGPLRVFPQYISRPNGILSLIKYNRRTFNKVRPSFTWGYLRYHGGGHVARRAPPVKMLKIRRLQI
jgi:hypothetical protein